MMPVSIIAAGRFEIDELFEVIGIAVLIAISIIGGLIQKRLASKEQEQRDRKRKAQDAQLTEDRKARPLRHRADRRPPWLVSDQARPEPEAPPTTQPGGVYLARPAAPPPPRPALQPKPHVLQPARATTQASLTATAEQISPAPPIRSIGLIDPTAARRAIIHHEIFSPPKALRNQPEMWET